MSTGPSVSRVHALVEEVLAYRLPAAQAEALAAELRRRLEEAEPFLLHDVNPPRTDLGIEWEHVRAAAYAETEHVRAVHLELGTFTTFPPERVAALRDGDGLSDFICLDADPRYDADVIADATALPFRSGSLDRVGSNSTLEHISDPHAVLAETLRVLRPGGIAVIAMPFVWPQHGYPDDYVRLTPGFFERVLTEIGFVDVAVDRDGSAGLYNTLHNAAKMAAVDDAQPEKDAMRDLHEVVVALLGLLVPFDRYFVDASREWFHSVRVIARAPGELVPRHRTSDQRRPFHERALDLLADPRTKEPLEAGRGELRAPSTGTAYRVTAGGGVNFLEPRVPGTTAGERARELTGRLRGIGSRARARYPGTHG